MPSKNTSAGLGADSAGIRVSCGTTRDSRGTEGGKVGSSVNFRWISRKHLTQSGRRRKLSFNRKRYGSTPEAREARRGVRSVWCETQTDRGEVDGPPPQGLPLGVGRKAQAPAGPQGSRSSGRRASRPGIPREVRRRKLTGYPGSLRVGGRAPRGREVCPALLGRPWRYRCRHHGEAVKPIPVVFHIGPLQVHTYGIGLASPSGSGIATSPSGSVTMAIPTPGSQEPSSGSSSCPSSVPSPCTWSRT